MQQPLKSADSLARSAAEALGRLSPWGFAGVIAALTVLTRLPLFLTDLINIDEAVWWMAGNTWAQGGVPYVDFIENKPPVLYALYALPHLFHVESLYALHWLVVPWTAATAWALERLARLLSGASSAKAGGRLAAVLYLLLSAAGSSRQFLFMSSEVAGLLPLAFSMWCFTRARMKKDPTGWLFAAGLLAATACFFRQTFALVPALMGLDLLCFPRSEAAGWSTRARSSAIFGAGSLVPPAFFLFYFVTQNALDDALYWMFEIHRDQIAVEPSLAFKLARFASGTLPSLAIGLPCWVILLRGCRISGWRESTENRHVLLWSFSALVALWTASLTGRWIAHYYLPTVAPLAVVTAVWVIKDRALKSLAGSAVALACAGTLIFSIAGCIGVVRGSFEEVSPTMKQAAVRIRSLTKENERIYIWGYGSTLNYRSRRQSASRFLIPSQPISGYQFGSEKAFPDSDPTALVDPRLWKQFIADLRESPPALFLDFAENDVHYFGRHEIERYPELAAWLKGNYVRLPDQGPIVFYQRKGLR